MAEIYGLQMGVIRSPLTIPRMILQVGREKVDLEADQRMSYL